MHSDRRLRSRPSPTRFLAPARSLSTSRRAACWPTPTRCSAGNENTCWNCPWCPAPARSAASAPPAPMRPGFVPAIGSIAIRPCAPATMRYRPTSPCRASPPAARQACACNDISTTAPGPNRCGCRRKTPFRSATSTRRTPAAGARSARCSCPMAGSSPRTCKPERSCWSMAPPAASAAPPSPLRWGWARSASSRPGGTSRR